MKKLTKSKRDTVRFLLKRALNDLKVAKDYTFKAYGSSDTTFDIKFAIGNLESALNNLPKTKLPKKTDASPADRPKDCPAKGNECPLQTQEVKKMTEDDIEKRFKEFFCFQLGIVSSEKCTPNADIEIDLGADWVDRIELANAIEDEFGICISDHEIGEMSTFGKLLDLVKSKIAAKEANPTSGEDA